MKSKKYTLKIEVTSSSFPSHPHLAVAVAKKMWSLGHDKIARLEGWKREKRNSLDGSQGYWGPFLTTEESLELPESDFKGTDDPTAVEPEVTYRNKYVERYSAPSTLAWIEDTYK